MEEESAGKLSPSFRESFHGKTDEWCENFKEEVFQTKVFLKIT